MTNEQQNALNQIIEICYNYDIPIEALSHRNTTVKPLEYTKEELIEMVQLSIDTEIEDE